MGITDAILNALMGPPETEEQKKKRLEEQLKNNPLYQASQRTNKIDQLIKDAQK